MADYDDNYDDEDRGDFYDRNGVEEDEREEEEEEDEGDDKPKGAETDSDLEDEEADPLDQPSVSKSRTSSHVKPMSDPIMTKFELGRLAGSLGEFYARDPPMNPQLTDVIKKKKLIDPLDIACEHLERQRHIPCTIYIKRPLPTGGYEKCDWKDMILPDEVINHQFI
jgi:hypothetical protein